MLRLITGAAIRRPVLVIVIWVAIVAAGFATGIGVFDRLVSDVGTVPGSESAQARQQLTEADPPQPALTAVVSGRPADDAATRASLERAISDVRGMPGVVAVSDPRPSARTGQALLVQVTLRSDDGGPAVAAARRLERVGPGDVVVAGGPLTEEEFSDQAQSDVQRAEMLSMPVVLVLLLLVFGGLLAAGLPLLIAAVGVGAAFGILYAFSLITDVSVYAIQIVTMLSVGLAVDYALLLVSRFREERAVDADVRAALERTAASAGRTILFTGLTVAVSLAGLLVFPDPFLRSMGLAGAAVVVVDMLAALTLLPALLVLFGARIAPATVRSGRGAGFARVARAVQRRPVLFLAGTVAVLAVLALPSLDLRLSGGDPRLLPSGSQTRQLHDTLATHFPGANAPDPVVVLASVPAGSPALAGFRAGLERVPGVTGVSVRPVGAGLTVLRAGTADDPASDAAAATVRAVRDLRAPFPVRVTGDAARMVDYRAMLAERIPWAAAVVVLATLLLLFAFTGSVLLPVKAVLTNLLSIAAALGAVVWGFQQGHLAGLFGTARMDSTNLTVPVLVVAIAFGLSVDYEVFLLSRIREHHAAGHGAREAVVFGMRHSGRIITAAAMLMAVVFGGFLVGGFAPIKQIGLGLVLAVVLDATVVRMLLVPATMTLMGGLTWWAPRPLRSLHRRIALAEGAGPAGAPRGELPAVGTGAATPAPVAAGTAARD